MRVKVVKKGGKYKRKFSLDVDDWIMLIIALFVLAIVAIQFILWS